ncbi:hypothetical protein SLS62_006048 [Diatrype stigma]|uniref:Uncharacterized protein n=1 Tax=Diatrype stigma TaxID=117547 RepID=A0AAN9US58_9PEZI
MKTDVYATTSDLDQYANMLWSFLVGIMPIGWLKSDEETWDEAINIVKRELRKTDGYAELPGGSSQIKFIANIAIAAR